jgi:hypothetical protein
MPNWVATVCEFTGEDKDIKAVLEEISSEESKFDFNKLIPMPASLEIESSTRSSLAYTYYYVKKFNRLPERKHSYYKDKSEVIERVEKDIKVSSQEMLEMGKTLYENIEKYGAPTWYDWCCNNWGTKWNACESEVYGQTLEFRTAWGFAEPVMRKLAELCVKYGVEFEGEWADEDMGCNTGYFESCNGELSYEYHTDCSSEAYATYVRCQGESLCLDTDANGNYYRHECDESCPNYKECMG